MSDFNPTPIPTHVQRAIAKGRRAAKRKAHSAAASGSARPWTHAQETEEMTRPSSRPEIRKCIECGDNEPETGMVCDECLFDALGDQAPNVGAETTPDKNL